MATSDNDHCQCPLFARSVHAGATLSILTVERELLIRVSLGQCSSRTVGSVGANSVAFRHCVRVDTELFHPCDERSPFESEPESSATWAADTAIGFLESLDDLIAINFGENTPYRSASWGWGGRVL